MNIKTIFFISFLLDFSNAFGFSFFRNIQTTKLLDNSDSLNTFSNNNNNLNGLTENKYAIFDLYDKIIPEDKKSEFGEALVKASTSWLPKADSIGHIILHKNEQFINIIFNNNLLSPELKKFLILNTIDLARNGDDMGSQILTFYHALVDHVL